MDVDSLTVAAVAAELEEMVVGGRVQRVLQSGPLTIALEVYARHHRRYLLLSADSERARVHLQEKRPTRDPRVQSPLLLHLRRRLVGATLRDVRSLPRERILLLHFFHPKMPPEEQENTLIVEVMGRRSNLILRDAEGIVVDCIKRVTPRMSPARPMLPRQRYIPPPEQVKADPRAVTAVSLQQALAGLDADTPLWRGLVHLYRGVSPLLAREVVFRAGGRPEMAIGEPFDPERLAGELGAFWDPARPAEPPCLALEGGRPVAFAPYRITHRPDWEVRPVERISQAIAQYFAHLHPLSGHEQTRSILREAIARQRQEWQRRLQALQAARERAGQADALRRKGEWLLAFQHQIPPGQRVFQVEGEEIELDPQKSPLENAQAYFAAYHKARQAEQVVPARMEETVASLDWLAEVEALLEVAETYDELALLAGELEEAGVLGPERRTPRRQAGLKPRTFRSSDGLTILVGRNARQNEDLSLRRARPDDLWFHARGVAGAHVILLTEGRPAPPQSLEEAASLAAYYSRARDERRVAVDYTECRHLRRATPHHPGLLRYKKERTLYVTPARLQETEEDNR